MEVAAQIGISRELLPLPGDSIAEALEEHALSVEAAAKGLNIQPQHLNKVIVGLAPITKTLAGKLSRLLDMPASFWENLQKDYDEAMSQLDEADGIDEEEVSILKRLEAHKLIEFVERWKGFDSNQPVGKQIIDLRNFFGICNLKSLSDYAELGAYRQANTNLDPYITGAWVLVCRQILHKRQVSKRFVLDRTNELVVCLKDEMLNLDRDLFRKPSRIYNQLPM